MNQEKYGQLFKRHVERTFDSNKDAAYWYECSPSMVSNVKAGKKRPNDLMLESTGHEWVNDIRKVK